MNKLEEVANAFASSETLSEYENSLCVSSFVAGAEWQNNNMWISVEEFGYPHFDKECEIAKRERYLLRFVYGSISQSVSYKVGCLVREDRFIEEMDWVSVTHWMPIPEIKKGE